MFGYVFPCKMELKIKDYEKFKAYYCGLCKCMKTKLGNVPRLCLNYDMNFLAILLDSLDNSKCFFTKEHCIAHPLKKKIILKNKPVLEYAAFFNILLAYNKLLDNVNDDNSIKSKLYSLILEKYINKIPHNLNRHIKYVENKLNELYILEKRNNNNSIDKLSHPFAELTGFILSQYKNLNDKDKNNLYWLGYNLGKWIYIIDSWDDLKKDLLNNKFNAISSVFNINNLPYETFSKNIKNRIEFILINCASQCVERLNSLSLKKNKDLLYNILQFGLMEKMDIVFKRSDN